MTVIYPARMSGFSRGLVLEYDKPLEEVFATFRDTAPSYMDEIHDSLSSTALSIIREKELADKYPLY